MGVERVIICTGSLFACIASGGGEGAGAWSDIRGGFNAGF